MLTTKESLWVEDTIKGTDDYFKIKCLSPLGFCRKYRLLWVVAGTIFIYYLMVIVVPSNFVRVNPQNLSL
jgi:hypothetical protein